MEVTLERSKAATAAAALDPSQIGKSVFTVDGSASLKKEWVLTQAAFDQLLSRLDADRERAGVRYEVVRSKLVKFFEWRGCASPDALADETLNRVARKIDGGEVIHNLNSYFYGVARMLFMETLKEREKEQQALDRLPTQAPTGEDCGETDSQLECFERCLGSLPADSRELITEYYQEEKGAKIDRRRVLAGKLGIPLNALRIRAHRIRARLEQCVDGCVKQQG